MSTTFGVIVVEKHRQEEELVEVAYRGNGTGIRFTNPIAHLLPDDTSVIPLDNSAQGIYTIGDIKREIWPED